MLHTFLSLMGKLANNTCPCFTIPFCADIHVCNRPNTALRRHDTSGSPSVDGSALSDLAFPVGSTGGGGGGIAPMARWISSQVESAGGV
jgi:hypothetical protein